MNTNDFLTVMAAIAAYDIFRSGIPWVFVFVWSRWKARRQRLRLERLKNVRKDLVDGVFHAPDDVVRGKANRKV